MEEQIENLAEGLFDDHSELISGDIDSLQYWSGRLVMTKKDFTEALKKAALSLSEVAPKQEQEVINQFTLGEIEGTFYVVKEDEDYVVCESDYKEWAEKIIETLNKEQKFPLCGD